MNKEIIQSLFENYINKRRLDELGDHIAPEYVDEYINIIRPLFTGFSDIRFTLLNLIEENDMVVVKWQWLGTHNGEFKGLWPSYNSVRTDGVGFYKLKNGKVIHSETVVDRWQVFQSISPQ